MGKIQDLEKADIEIRELSVRIEGIKFHIRSLENNIALLNSLRIQFEQNIDVLKGGLVIAAIDEYKKIKEELQTIRNRLQVMRVDFNNHNLALSRSERFLIELQAKYAILLKEQSGRVIKVNFGGKK